MNSHATPAIRRTAHAACSRRGVVALLGAAWLAGCTTRSQVGLASHINFAPPPVSDPAPLLQGPQAIAAALGRGAGARRWGAAAT